MGRLIWLGHSTFYLELDDTKILIDPWISNPKAPQSLPDLSSLDLVVVTHGHFDHVGDAVDVMKKSKDAKLVAIYEVASDIASKGIGEDRVIGGNIGGPIHTGINGIKVALTSATHSSPQGSPTGVVIIGKEASIYHAGDTGVTMDMKLIGEIYRPKIALLPIGGHFTMDPVEAAYAVELLKPEIAIPMHYGTFPVLYGDPNNFKDLVSKRVPGTKVVVLNPGEAFTF